MKTPTFLTLLTSLGSLNAATVIATDFSGRTISSSTVSDIPYTLEGIQSPGDLIVSGSTLYDTSDAANHVAGTLNTNGRTWRMDVPLVFLPPTIGLNIANDDVLTLDFQHFNSNGAFQGNSRTTRWVVSIIGSGGTVALSEEIFSGPASSGILNFFDGQSASLDNSETWTLRFEVGAGGGEGNRTGIDSFSLEGTVVPEPSSAILLLSSLLITATRRKR